MKTTIVGCLIFGAATFTALAPLLSIRPYEELYNMSDVVVVAKPLATKDTDEKTTLRTRIQIVGVSTEFQIIAGLKGAASLKQLTVHHYRFASPDDAPMVNCPNLAWFDPKKSTRYLLFLQRESDGRYAPFDQDDPALTSLLALEGTEWDKMTPDTYMTWLDTKKWRGESPNPGVAISPEIKPAGRAEGSLHEAAMNGKLEKAKALIKSNPELVFSLHGDMTPLQFAARYGEKDVAELLLANKAEVEARSSIGWTPLMHAAMAGHKEMVELLLAKGANVNYQDDSGRSALLLAAESGHTEAAALLLAHGADVNAKCRRGYAPLHAAAVDSRRDLVDLLVAHNADYNIQDAAAVGDLERVKALVKYNPGITSGTDFCGSTALFWAVVQGHKNIVEFLLANRADVNAKRAVDGMTPLNMAVRFGKKDIADLLRQHGGKE
jgi:ankyrin repeat protein